MSSNTPSTKTSYRPRLKGEARVTKRRELAKRYDAGASIRALAEREDLSYCTTRKLLLEARVKLRGRGGRVRRARAETP